MSEFKYDKDQLLDHTNGGLDIIRRLYPECEKGNKFVHFKLREEATASVNVFKSGDLYLVKDHGDGKKAMNAIDLVMEHESISFSDALKWIAQEFQVSGNATAFNRPQLEFKKATKDQKPGEYYYEFKDFTEKELAVLGPLVTAEICAEYHLRSVESFTQIKQYKDHHKYGNDTMQIITKSNENYPIFVFDFDTWQKIYQPLNQDKQYRFRYVGSKPRDFVFGLDTLKDKLDQYREEYDGPEPDIKLPNIIIASGDRDALNVASLGYPVIWLNSESAKLEYSTYKTLLDFADVILYLGDIDDTGVKETISLALQYIHIKIIWLPEWLKNYTYRGKPRKDFKDYVDYTFKPEDPERLARQFKGLVQDALPARFWDYDPSKKQPYSLNNEACYRFLTYNGFYLFEEEDAKDPYSFIRIDKGVVERLKYHHIANFPAEYIKSKRIGIPLLNFIHRSTQLSEKNLSNIQEKKVDFSDSSYDHQLMFFNNKIWKVTAEGTTEHNYGDLETHVWKDKIIDHSVKVNKQPAFKITHDGTRYDIVILTPDNQFLNYLINTSRVHWRKCGDAPFKHRLKEINTEDPEEYNRQATAIKKDQAAYREANKFNIAEEGLTDEEIQEQKEQLINKIFAYGYLLHKKKVVHKAWCVYAMDRRISSISESNGGSGKSILFNMAVRSVLLSNMYRDGRDPKQHKNNHIYEGITKNSDYVVYDDADSFFPFTSMFTQVTGDLPVNPKHGKQYIVPFTDSPKFAVTTNYGLFNTDPSTSRRVLFTEFSDYYHHISDLDDQPYTPVDDFGKTIFAQFDEKEWNEFFNVSAEALQFFLSQDNVKINPPGANIEKRNALQDMGDSFKDWADNYFTEDLLDEVISKLDATNHFENHTKIKNWSPQRFKKSLISWCKFNGYEFNPEDKRNNGKRIVYNNFGTSQEGIYIRTKKTLNQPQPTADQPDQEDTPKTARIDYTVALKGFKQ